MKDTKLRSLLTEQTFSKYEEYSDALMKAKEINNYQEFERIITDSLKRKQWEWFGRYYQTMNGSSNELTKEIFKKVTPF